MSTAAVVESSPLAPRLAEILEARLIPDAAAADGDETLVMVASNVADVRAVADAVRAGQALAAVVAWHLSESALVQLLELPVPCLIGEPKPTQLRDVVSGASRGVNARNERTSAAGYAMLESWLAQPAQSLPDEYALEYAPS